jgi:hypothetical protein
LLTRRTWGTAQFTSELIVHVEWWRAYYPFARYHEALRVERPVFRQPEGRPVSSGYRARTPATLAPALALRASAGVAAGLTPRRWTTLELIGTPMD